MLTQLFRGRVLCLVLVGVLVVLGGCKREAATTPATEAAPAETVAPAEAAAPAVTAPDEKPGDIASGLDPMAEVKAKLAKADLLDGKGDKIITRCASCALKMDGKPEHSLEVLGYTMYFCSDKCLKGFSANTMKSVADLVVPEG